MPLFTRVNEGDRVDRQAVTSADVARETGVSRATVSYVLNGRTDVAVAPDTRRRVLEAARRLGYRRNGVATALRSGRMNTVGILSAWELNPAIQTDPVFVYAQNVLTALMVAAGRAGLNATLFMEKAYADVSIDDLADRRADGFVFLGLDEKTTGFAEMARQVSLPHVEVNTEHGLYSVCFDNDAGMAQAVAHLWGLGHRRFAYWSLPDREQMPVREREDAFRRELTARGVEPGDARVVHSAEELASLIGPGAPRPLPSVVVVYSDVLALRLLDLAADLGLRVPHDLSVVGFDDTVLAAVCRPALTTVHNPLDVQATTAIELIQAQLAGTAPPDGDRRRIAPHLVVRGSTGPPPHR